MNYNTGGMCLHMFNTKCQILIEGLPPHFQKVHRAPGSQFYILSITQTPTFQEVLHLAFSLNTLLPGGKSKPFLCRQKRWHLCWMLQESPTPPSLCTRLRAQTMLHSGHAGVYHTWSCPSRLHVLWDQRTSPHLSAESGWDPSDRGHRPHGAHLAKLLRCLAALGPWASFWAHC